MRAYRGWCVRVSKEVIVIDGKCVENFKDSVCHGCMFFDMLKNVRGR